jgi:hypothetical protein
MILSGSISSFDQNCLCFVLRKMLCGEEQRDEQRLIEGKRVRKTYLENVVLELEVLLFELVLEVGAVE